MTQEQLHKIIESNSEEGTSIDQLTTILIEISDGIKEVKSRIHGNLPEFIELPKNGEREHYSGLGRSYLNSLILPTVKNNYKPPVKSHSIRPRGALRGKRLIVLDSLLSYIKQQSTENTNNQECSIS